MQSTSLPGSAGRRATKYQEARSCRRGRGARGAGPRRCCVSPRRPSAGRRPHWAHSIVDYRRGSAKPRLSPPRPERSPCCSTMRCVTAWTTRIQAPRIMRNDTEPASWRTFGAAPKTSALSSRRHPPRRRCFSGNSGHLLGGAEMRFRLIEDQRDVWPVRVMCDALSVSPSGYYVWRSRPESVREIDNRELLVDIRLVHTEHRGRYGAPRIHAELRAEGQSVSRKRVERVMRWHGIRAHAPRRYRVCTTDSKHSLPVAANLLDRNFAAEKPDQIWLTDITYIPTGEGWLYLAVILDLFTRKVVGWAMRDHMRAELAIAALTMAIQRRRPT